MKETTIQAIERLQKYIEEHNITEEKVNFGAKATPEQIKETEEKLNIKFPKSYVQLMTEYGAFYMDMGGQESYNFFEINEEYIEDTSNTRKIYVENFFDTDDPTHKPLIEILEKMVFFQFVDWNTVENYFAFYTGNEGIEIRQLDHDDVDIMEDTVANDFDTHMSKLVDEIIEALD